MYFSKISYFRLFCLGCLMRELNTTLILVPEVINEWIISQDVFINGFGHINLRSKNFFCLIWIYFMCFVLWVSIAFKLSPCVPERLNSE